MSSTNKDDAAPAVTFVIGLLVGGVFALALITADPSPLSRWAGCSFPWSEPETYFSR